MLRDTIKNVINGTKNTLHATGAAGRGETRTWNTAHGRHAVMWYAGYKFTISVDDWMRGH